MAAEFAAGLLILRLISGEPIRKRNQQSLFYANFRESLSVLRGTVVDLLRALHHAVDCDTEATIEAAAYVSSVFSSVATPDDVGLLVDKLRERIGSSTLGDGSGGTAAVAPGQAELPDPSEDDIPNQDALTPPVVRLDRNSALAVILRRVVLATQASGFDGVLRLLRAVQTSVPALHRCIQRLRAHSNTSAAADACAHAFAATSHESIDPNSSSSPAVLRERYVAAIGSRDFAGAVRLLHAYFDRSYGSGLFGGTPLTGDITPLSVLTNMTGALGGPFARVQELLLSAASAAPVGGFGVGRSLTHFGLLHLASLQLHFGHTSEASDALQECIRVAQACGDHSAASYALQLLAEAAETEERAAAAASGVNTGSNTTSAATSVLASPALQMPLVSSEAVDMLQRSRQRAAELGLWRQQVSSSLLLVEHACTESAIAAAVSATAAAQQSRDACPPVSPLPLPDWLSLDPYTSYRCGGYMVGAVTPSSASAAASATASHIAPEMVQPSITGTGREGLLGNTAVTAITSSTATSAAALLRRYRAFGDERDRLNPGAGLAAAAPSIGAAGAHFNPLAVQQVLSGAGAMWSNPYPMSWQEVVSAHAQSHSMHARVWETIAAHSSTASSSGGSSSGGSGYAAADTWATVAEVMKHASQRCAAVAAACVDRAPNAAPEPNVAAALAALGCSQAQIARAVR
jgi:hypothetical protein